MGDQPLHGRFPAGYEVHGQLVTGRASATAHQSPIAIMNQIGAEGDGGVEGCAAEQDSRAIPAQHVDALQDGIRHADRDDHTVGHPAMGDLLHRLYRVFLGCMDDIVGAVLLGQLQPPLLKLGDDDGGADQSANHHLSEPHLARTDDDDGLPQASTRLVYHGVHADGQILDKGALFVGHMFRDLDHDILDAPSESRPALGIDEVIFTIAAPASPTHPHAHLGVLDGVSYLYDISSPLVAHVHRQVDQGAPLLAQAVLPQIRGAYSAGPQFDQDIVGPTLRHG